MHMFLTTDEATMLQNKAVDTSAEITTETLPIYDTKTDFVIRMHLAEFEAKSLNTFQKKSEEFNNVDKAIELYMQTDFSDINEHDEAELLYALGPIGISSVIERLLKDVETENDIQLIAALSTARHEFLTQTIL